MADIEDLGYPSIADMQTDEALEMLRQIRLSRRTPTKSSKITTKRSTASVKVSTDQAAELLKLIGGTNE